MVIYDKEEDILFLSKGKKIQASIDVGDFIIDVDKRGFITGIEILNASENLKLDQLQLKELKKASMVVTYKPNHVYLYLVMLFKQKEKEITIPLTVDLGHGSVTSEKMSFATT